MRFPDDAPPVGLPRYAVDLDAPGRPGDDGGTRTVADSLGLAVRPVGSARLEGEMQRARIGRALGTLPPRLRVAVALVYGLDGGPALPLAEVGAALGCSKQAVHARLRRALPALAAALAEGRR